MNKELNELMAEVMGYADYIDGKAAVPVMVGDGETMVDIDFDWIVWNPTEDIAQAKQCIEKYCDDNNCQYDLIRNGKAYVCGIIQCPKYVYIASVYHKTLELAICEAIKEARGKNE